MKLPKEVYDMIDEAENVGWISVVLALLLFILASCEIHQIVAPLAQG